MKEMLKKAKPKYVCTEEDPRSVPLDRCVSLGDLMATIEKCKELDRKEDK